MSFLDEALGPVTSALLGPAGAIVGPLMGELLQGAGGAAGAGASLFGGAAQGLGGMGMFGQAFGGLFSALNPTKDNNSTAR